MNKNIYYNDNNFERDYERRDMRGRGRGRGRGTLDYQNYKNRNIQSSNSYVEEVEID
jgi:hypothetical protein